MPRKMHSERLKLCTESKASLPVYLPIYRTGSYFFMFQFSFYLLLRSYYVKIRVPVVNYMHTQSVVD